MKILKYGSEGPSVQLLQLALNRAGYGELALDGVFGMQTRNAVLRFQSDNGLVADGIVGPATHRALVPWYTGYAVHRIHRGDTLFLLAQQYGTSLEAINIANPNLVAENLQLGSSVTVPLPFDVVPTNISFTSALVSYCVRGIAARYPFIKVGEVGKSVMGRTLWFMLAGSGGNRVFYNASHHANEWITTPVLLKFAEQLASAYAYGGNIFGQSAAEIFARSNIYIAP